MSFPLLLCVCFASALHLLCIALPWRMSCFSRPPRFRLHHTLCPLLHYNMFQPHRPFGTRDPSFIFHSFLSSWLVRHYCDGIFRKEVKCRFSLRMLSVFAGMSTLKGGVSLLIEMKVEMARAIVHRLSPSHALSLWNSMTTRMIDCRID